MMVENDIRSAIQTKPWENLYDLGSTEVANIPKTSTSAKNLITSGSDKTPLSLTSDGKILAYDVTAYIDSQFRQRQQRLNMSVRDIEKAKTELLNKSLIKEVWVGKSLFFVATSKLYQIVGIESPYKRNISDIHSFLVLLTLKLIEPNPLIQSIKIEAFLGDSSSTADLLVCMKNGQRWAYEVTLSSSNVSANAAKLQNKGFSQIIFVCQDFNLKQAVWAKIRNAGFDPDFLSTIRCTIFSALIRQRKEMRLREI